MATRKKKRSRKNDLKGKPQRTPLSQRVGVFVLTTGVILFILYIALLILPRSEGFKYALQERLMESENLRIEFAKSKMTCDLRLKLYFLKWMDDEEEDVGFTADEVTVAFSWRSLLRNRDRFVKRIRIVSPSLTLREQGDATWRPARFNVVGTWISQWAGLPASTYIPPRKTAGRKRTAESGFSGGQGAEMDTLSRIFDHAAISFVDASIHWETYQGENLAAVEGVRAWKTPLVSEKHELTHYVFEADSILYRGRLLQSDVRIEVADSSRGQFLLSLQSERHEPGASNRREVDAVPRGRDVVIPPEPLDGSENIRDELKKALAE